MPLKVRVRAKIQLTFLDYLLQELVVVRGGVQVYHPSLLIFVLCVVDSFLFYFFGSIARSPFFGSITRNPVVGLINQRERCYGEATAMTFIWS